MKHRFSDFLLAIVFFSGAGLMLQSALASRSAQANTIDGLEHAVRLTPWSGEYRERLAFRYAREERTAEAKAQLTSALELEPARASVMLHLARIAETEGNFADAEAWLTRAAGADRQLAPAWALANFYLRREDQPHFWKWLSRAYAISRSNTAPIWQLAGRVEPDALNVLRLLDVRDREQFSEYLRYLRETADARNSFALVEHLPNLQPRDREAVLWICDDLLQHNNIKSAKSLWMRLQSANLAPESDAMNLLVNAGFFTAPSGKCFDWRVPPQIDVTALFEGGGTAHFSLAGRQQMDVVLMEQVIPVEAGARYEFSWSARLDAVAARAGLTWEVVNGAPGIVAQSPPLDSAQWRTGGVRFTAPAQLPGCTLRLRYKRPEGFTRVEGDLYIKDLRLRKL